MNNNDSFHYFMSLEALSPDSGDSERGGTGQALSQECKSLDPDYLTVIVKAECLSPSVCCILLSLCMMCFSFASCVFVQPVLFSGYMVEIRSCGSGTSRLPTSGSCFTSSWIHFFHLHILRIVCIWIVYTVILVCWLFCIHNMYCIAKNYISYFVFFSCT